MSYSNKIHPALKSCPVCSRWLAYGTIQSGIKTSCKCGFEEAPGSLYVLQYIGDVMAEYAKFRGIHSLQGLGGDKHTINKGFALGGYGYLSILQKRNISMVFGSTSQTNLFKGSDLFGVIGTTQGVVGERIYMNPNSYSSDEIKHLLVNQLISLTYVVDETMSLSSQSPEQRASDTLYIPDISGIEIHAPKQSSINAITADSEQSSTSSTEMGMS